MPQNAYEIGLWESENDFPTIFEISSFSFSPLGVPTAKLCDLSKSEISFVRYLNLYGIFLLFGFLKSSVKSSLF